MNLYEVEFISVEQRYGVFYRVVAAETPDIAKLYFMEQLYPDTRVVSAKVRNEKHDDPIVVPAEYVPKTTKTQFRVFERDYWGGYEGGPCKWEATDFVEPIKFHAEHIAHILRKPNHQICEYVVCEELCE